MKELAKDEKLKNEDWERFLPKFSKKNVPRKKATTKKVEAKKAYTPFPPAPTPRKVDMQLETGEYFATEDERKAQKLLQKKKQSQETSKEKRQRRELQDQTVPEPKTKKAKVGGAADVDLARLQAKFQAQGTSKNSTNISLSDFVQDSGTSSDSKDKKKKKSTGR